MSVCQTTTKNLAQIRLSSKVCETPRRAPRRCAYEVPIVWELDPTDPATDIVDATFSFAFEPEDNSVTYLVQDLILDDLTVFDSDGNIIDNRLLDIRLQSVDYDGESYWPKTAGNESQNIVDSAQPAGAGSEISIQATQTRAQVYDFGESAYAGGTRAKAALKTVPFLKHDVSQPFTLQFVVRLSNPANPPASLPVRALFKDANLVVVKMDMKEADEVIALSDSIAS